MASSTHSPWRSTSPFSHERIGAVAIYCSDGRFGEAFDDFLHNGLGLPRYDRLAVPGGAACLAGHTVTWREEEAIGKQLKFLIEIHGIGRAVLIAHRPCAFYSRRLQLRDEEVERRQCEDLARARAFVHRVGPQLGVEAFVAEVHEGSVVFTSVPI